MKKNNPYLADDEIVLGDFIKSLWKEKILILSISIICGLAGYLYASFQPQEFKAKIKLKNPPSQLFEVYSHELNYRNSNSNIDLRGQFIFDFKLNFLSLNNLQNFTEESREFDNFKEYLRLRNISSKKYFENKIHEVKEKNLIIPNEYFLVYTKELDGDIFLNNYAQFIKKKTVFEIKKNLKLSIKNKIAALENALEKAILINLENPILINLENPILKSTNQKNIVVTEWDDLFYKGSKILLQEIIYLNRFLIKLENDQFNFEILSDNPLSFPINKNLNLTYLAIGTMFGLFLSFGIILFRSILKNN
jgi:LPS O-antigen subunit length determinant protein (WzzB/FepE family)